MLVNLQKCPFPWFGGKADAAPHVWQAFGDVPHFVDPFCGSLAVLLRRPHPANRTYFSETVNDIDGLLVNFWRSIQLSPQETAEAASWPVSEFDKHARSVAVLKWRESEGAAHLAGDPTFHDPIMAGWWAWCVCCQIGAWGVGGPWWPDQEGKLRRRGNGVDGKCPHLTSDGRGVNRPQLREPGLGIPADRPHLASNGQGVNHAGCREPGLTRDDLITRDYTETGGYHPCTMPKMRRWFDYLAARLRHVRIVNGDWTRVVTTGAACTLPVRQGQGPCGIFFDPPYGDVGRSSLYGKHESFDVAADVRAWCLEHGDDKRYRIVYAGFDVEGAELEAAGWSVVEWFKVGHLKGGMKQQGPNGHQQHRERLWCSPHCEKRKLPPAQTSMFTASTNGAANVDEPGNYRQVSA